ncbi:hypothetical protein EauM23_00047 [Exiguobacterium phage vB_EauM-23]|nr:hypothetical protein EauM23_00047 [Exiguobacterium phage vB_EauM-23]
MKKVFKFFIITFFVLVGLGIAASLGETDQEQTAQPVDEVVAEKAEAEAPKEEAKEEPKSELPGKVEYDAVKNGMTREQVEQLFEKVDVISESESEVAGYSSLAVSYKASGDLGANIFIIFMDGVVESKSNFGVK